MLAAVLSGCIGGRSAKNTIRFRYWGDLEEIRIIEELCKEFEKAHPGVHVKPERKTPDITYADVLLQEFAANNAPDVIFVSPDNLEILSEAGKLADLTPFIAKDTELKVSDYYDVLIQRFSSNGKLLAIPRDIAPIACVFYNKDLFDQAGLAYPKDDWHWEELEEAAKKLTHRDANGKATQYGFADEINLAEAWVLAAGGTMVDDYVHPTRFTMAESPGVDGILFRWKLLQVDRVMPSSSETRSYQAGGGALGVFLNGQVAMLHTGIWKTPEFRKITRFHWDVARFPTKKGAKDPGYIIASSGYTMKNDAANPELCWQLIKFMGGPIGQTRLAQTGLAQPSLKALADSPVFLDGQDPKNKKMLIDAAKHGHCPPAWGPWQEFLRAVWLPGTDPIWLSDFKGDPLAVVKEVAEKGNQKYFKAK